MKNEKKTQAPPVAPSGNAAEACMVAEDNLTLLHWLIDYELKAAKRYRRFVTLIMITPLSVSNFHLCKMLYSLKRDSDRIFELEGDCAILMPETDMAGGRAMINRIKSFIKDEIDLRFSIASFPIDGTHRGDLVETACRRLGEAKLAESGTVVSNG